MLRIRTRNGRIVVGWCAVINENHMFIWVEIYFIKISSSTRTLFAPPRGISAILPSRKYRATILLAVDRFTPIVAASVK